jgi:putative cofactor-binding repeat protein
VVRASLRVIACLVAALVVAPAALAHTYYVSPHGHDGASGGSPAHAWRTVFRVDKASLRPGDVVLFQGGARFSDDTLMPGWGLSVSGSRGAPVTFSSYGRGRAMLSKGIWIKGERYLVFSNLALGPREAISGYGTDDTVRDCAMRWLMGGVEIGVDVIGSRWTIVGNTIDHTGDSGMLLRGDHFYVAGNTITNTSLDHSLTYGSHGIYLKAADSTVTGNTIRGFRDDGVSVRYRNSVVTGNRITGGKFGIAWFQYDTVEGTSRWTGNTIVDPRIAGIYVSPHDIGGTTRENFVIRDNRIIRPSGRRAVASSAWQPISLSANHGWYSLGANVVVGARTAARRASPAPCRRRRTSTRARRCRRAR